MQASPDHALHALVQGDPDALRAALESAESPANLVAVGGYGAVAALLASDRTLFRRSVARLFVVGGHAGAFVPINPRLAERHPERFLESGDPRVEDLRALGALLMSGEAVIWLPRDLCLWRCDIEGITEMPVLLSALPAFCLAAHPDPTLWLRWFSTTPVKLLCDEEGRVTGFDTKASPNAHAVIAVDGHALNRRLGDTMLT